MFHMASPWDAWGMHSGPYGQPWAPGPGSCRKRVADPFNFGSYWMGEESNESDSDPCQQDTYRSFAAAAGPRRASRPQPQPQPQPEPEWFRDPITGRVYRAAPSRAAQDATHATQTRASRAAAMPEHAVTAQDARQTYQRQQQPQRTQPQQQQQLHQQRMQQQEQQQRRQRQARAMAPPPPVSAPGMAPTGPAVTSAAGAPIRIQVKTADGQAETRPTAAPPAPPTAAAAATTTTATKVPAATRCSRAAHAIPKMTPSQVGRAPGNPPQLCSWYSACQESAA